MGVYLRAKFEVSSTIWTGFRQGIILPPLPPTSKRTPKKPIQIRINTSSGKFNKFDGSNTILFRVKVFVKNIKEATLASYFI